MPDQNGSSRLDRIERILELLVSDHVQFREEHKQLLTSQVLLTDRMDKLTISVDKLAQSQQLTDLKMQETTEKLNALIEVVDGLFHKGPPQ